MKLRYFLMSMLVILLGACSSGSTSSPNSTSSTASSSSPANTTPEAVITQAFDLMKSGDTVSLESLCTADNRKLIADDMFATWKRITAPRPANVQMDSRIGPVQHMTVHPATIAGQTATVLVDLVHESGTSVWKGTLRPNGTAWTIDRLTTEDLKVTQK